MTIGIRVKPPPNVNRLWASLAAVLTTALTLPACGGNDNTPQAAQAVYKNGTILTVDGKDTVAQAVAVREGKLSRSARRRRSTPTSGPPRKLSTWPARR